MARARNIKPGFFTNDELVELPFEARLLFIGLWTIADREGRMVDRPRKIKMEIFPADDVDCDKALALLADSGFITRYQVGEYKVIEILNFCKHQAPHSTEKDSVLPDAAGYFTVNERSKNGGITGISRKERSLSEVDNSALTLDNVSPPLEQVIPQSHNALIPECGILIPESFRTSTASSTSDDVRQCPTEELVELYHELLPNNPRVKVVNAARRSAIRSRWVEASKLRCAPFGYATRAEGLAAWREFFEICATSRFLTGLSPPSPGRPIFIADIDFLFNASSFAKTLENKFHRDAP